MSVKPNENQSVLTEKLIDISRKKINTELCDPDKTLANTKDCLSNIAGVKFIRFSSSG